jgi:hypothetical protein
VREGRVKHYTGKNLQIGPGRADMTAPSFATNKVDGGPEWHQVNSDGANQGDHANPKGRQDREAMTLYHSTPDCSVEVAEVVESPAEG